MCRKRFSPQTQRRSGIPGAPGCETLLTKPSRHQGLETKSIGAPDTSCGTRAPVDIMQYGNSIRLRWEAIDGEPIVDRIYQDCHLWLELRCLDDSDRAAKTFLTPAVSQIDAEPNKC